MGNPDPLPLTMLHLAIVFAGAAVLVLLAWVGISLLYRRRQRGTWSRHRGRRPPSLLPDLRGNPMPQEPVRKDTTNQHDRDKTTKEIQVHNSREAHKQNQEDGEHSGHKGRPTKRRK